MGERVKRREFIKAVVAASVTTESVLGQQAAAPVAPSVTPPAPAPAPGPLPWMRGLLEVKPLAMTPLVPDAVADAEASFFSPAQAATLRRLCEVLMPPLHGRPGAIEAGAPEFLDFLVGASPAEQQAMYRSGLDRLNVEAEKQFGTAFARGSDEQADQLLRPWLRTWMADHPPREPYARFINLAHSDIRTATINSEAWGEADIGLYWFPVDPDLTQEAGSTRGKRVDAERRS